MAVQMFKDLYLNVIKGKYDLCYYMKVPNNKGAYLDIKTTERILANIPLKDLSPELILQKYKKIQYLKNTYINYGYGDDDNNTDYYDGVEEYHKKQYRRNYEYEY
jgi:hypothetical protein